MMNAANAAIRANGELMNGSAAIRGATSILPIVMAFGRLSTLSERFQDQLAHGFQGVEHPLSADRHRLEVGSPLDPLACRKLVRQVLTRMVGVRNDAPLRRLRMLPPRIQRGLKVGYGCGVREIALVVLHHERNL